MRAAVRTFAFAVAFAAATTASARLPRATAAAASLPSARDGHHDFDFEFGAWRARLAVRLPLSHARTWKHFAGTSVVRPLWGGLANIGELRVSGPGGRLDALSLRLYDPPSHAWHISFGSSRSGSLSVPTIGHFANGVGTFNDQESFDGRTVGVRFTFSGITRHAFEFAQAYSADGGRTWETNWIARFTR